MRKLISVIFMIFAFTVLSAVSAIGADGSETVVMQIDNPVMTFDGESRNIDESGSAPVIINDRTYVPVRGLVEALGGSADWDSESRTAILKRNNDEIRLTIDSLTAYYNNNAVEIDTAPVIVNNRTMLPARFIAESFGYSVGWDSETKTITITLNTQETTETATETTTEAVTEEEREDTADMGNVLVAYFSNTGNTESVANTIAQATDGDIYEIVPSEPYTDEDLDYNNDNSRANIEQSDPDARPFIDGVVENMNEYDTVFIGYPIWWGDAPKIMCTFVEGYDFTDKTIVPFCTSGGSGISTSEDTLEGLAGEGNWLEGRTFDRNASVDDINEWLVSIGLK